MLVGMIDLKENETRIRPASYGFLINYGEIRKEQTPSLHRDHGDPFLTVMIGILLRQQLMFVVSLLPPLAQDVMEQLQSCLSRLQSN
jgi:hypothetical protein